MLAYTKDNKVIHINNALPKTDYFCAKCSGRLRVRNGKIRAKYFAHMDYEKGGLVYEAIKDDGYAPPFLCPYFNKDVPIKYKGKATDLSWKKAKMYEASLSSRGKKFKVYLEEKSGDIKVKSESFFITIYDYINMNYYFDNMNTFSIKLVSEDVNLKGDISIVLDEKQRKFYKLNKIRLK